MFFKVSQHISDKVLLENFISFLDCGIVNSDNSNALKFIVTKFSDINEKIIPFLKITLILGVKFLDFDSWCQVAEIMKTKGHLIPKGLDNIMDIKLTMNSNRIIDTLADLDFKDSNDSDAFDLADNYFSFWI
uniref:Homing endonuclease LAGLIDADG domain-containing protein n=1 Tax=Orbilia brochopaga TaxID=3140254 RepID=A0A4Y5MZY9_9PEZI|nr:hypothetical protein [Drechslerella brochopaga]